MDCSVQSHSLATTLKELELLNNIDIYPKILVALAGLMAAFIKIKENFSATKRKQELKIDLEIYELLKRNNELTTLGIQNKIEKKVATSFDDDNEGLTNFFVGIAVFVGFGLWTIDIY